MKQLEEALDCAIDYDKGNGLVPVIVQDQTTLEVLMLAYANREAVQVTQETGKATFWSRSRSELWTKGLTSGNVLQVSEVRVDCDQDTLLYLVQPQGGGACHTNDERGEARYSCFYRTMAGTASLDFVAGRK